MASCHFTPKRLLTAAPKDKTREVNQNPFTALLSTVVVFMYENWIMVAVTAEQKVANVDRFKRLAVVCFCCDWMIGTPASIVSSGRPTSRGYTYRW